MTRSYWQEESDQHGYDDDSDWDETEESSDGYQYHERQNESRDQHEKRFDIFGALDSKPVLKHSHLSLVTPDRSFPARIICKLIPASETKLGLAFAVDILTSCNFLDPDPASRAFPVVQFQHLLLLFSLNAFSFVG